MAILIHLAATFAVLSLLAVGGGTAVLPEMQVVLANQFNIDHLHFVQVYSIGQLAPGPNMLMVLVFGFQIAGFIGSLIVLLSFFLPSSALCYFAGRIWVRVGENPWRRAVQNALEPISIGLMASGVYAVAKASIIGPITITLCLTSLYLIMKTKINPVFVILGIGLVGSIMMRFFGVK